MSGQDPAPPPIQPPKKMPPPTAPQGTGFADTLIPTGNPKALLAYYLGLFSIFPVFGLAMGVIAVSLGRKGLAAIKETPGLSGSTHAKVGIGCGAFGFLFNLALVLLVLSAFLFSSKKS